MVLVWVTAVGGETCTEVDELVFVEHFGSYEVAVNGPPGLDSELCVPSPVDLGDPGPLGVGLLALIDAYAGQQIALSGDPPSLLEWFSGGGGSLGDLLVAEGGAVAAVASSYALIVSVDGPAFSAPYCRFDEVMDGLVLYDDRGSGCGGWVPLAGPGERTAYQGIDLVRP